MYRHPNKITHIIACHPLNRRGEETNDRTPCDAASEMYGSIHILKPTASAGKNRDCRSHSNHCHFLDEKAILILYAAYKEHKKPLTVCRLASGYIASLWCVFQTVIASMQDPIPKGKGVEEGGGARKGGGMGEEER